MTCYIVAQPSVLPWDEVVAVGTGLLARPAPPASRPPTLTDFLSLTLATSQSLNSPEETPNPRRDSKKRGR